MVKTRSLRNLTAAFMCSFSRVSPVFTQNHLTTRKKINLLTASGSITRPILLRKTTVCIRLTDDVTLAVHSRNSRRSFARNMILRNICDVNPKSQFEIGFVARVVISRVVIFETKRYGYFLSNGFSARVPVSIAFLAVDRYVARGPKPNRIQRTV